MVIVQVVRTRWTKASRGHPGATARAGLPAAVAIEGPAPLDGRDGTDRVLVETFEADEADGFALVHRVDAVDELPVRVANLVIEREGDRVVVTRQAERGTGWPARSPAVVAFRLRPGEWGRILRNHRFSGSSIGWSYEKTSVNVAHVTAFDRRTFVDGEPDHVRDEQAHLF